MITLMPLVLLLCQSSIHSVQITQTDATTIQIVAKDAFVGPTITLESGEVVADTAVKNDRVANFRRTVAEIDGGVLTLTAPDFRKTAIQFVLTQDDTAAIVSLRAKDGRSNNVALFEYLRDQLGFSGITFMKNRCSGALADSLSK